MWICGDCNSSSVCWFHVRGERASGSCVGIREGCCDCLLDMPGALAAGVSGAGAATDLLDATFSQGMGSLLLPRLICWTRQNA